MPDRVPRPVLLDLYSKAGGAGKGYELAGFDVVGVDLEPQPRYPFRFEQADALEVLAELASTGEWRGIRPDAVHASPPCQAFTDLRSRHPTNDYPDLVAPTRDALLAWGGPYVIENVSRRAGLLGPVRLCGSSFGLGVRRHRLFECSFPALAPPCAHHLQPPKYRIYERGAWRLSSVARVYGHGGGKANEHWSEAMGIEWMTPAELAQAIPPAYTEHVGGYLMAEVRARARAAA